MGDDHAAHPWDGCMGEKHQREALSALTLILTRILRLLLRQCCAGTSGRSEDLLHLIWWEKLVVIWWRYKSGANITFSPLALPGWSHCCFRKSNCEAWRLGPMGPDRYFQVETWRPGWSLHTSGTEERWAEGSPKQVPAIHAQQWPQFQGYFEGKGRLGWVLLWFLYEIIASAIIEGTNFLGLFLTERRRGVWQRLRESGDDF